MPAILSGDGGDHGQAQHAFAAVDADD